MKTRQDAWTKENDLLLAETVLRHIREGSTQLNAFEEVGDKLNRTSAACGFRWNAVVRDQYDKEIQVAKKQRKQRQRALNQKTRPLYTPPEPTLDFDDVDEVNVQQRAKATTIPKKQTINLTMDKVVNFLQNFDNNDSSSSKFKTENELLKKEIDNLSSKNEKLLEKIKETEKEYESVQQDYQALVQIMDRARKMVLFEEQDTPTNTFKMDRNGNLERVAK